MHPNVFYDQNPKKLLLLFWNFIIKKNLILKKLKILNEFLYLMSRIIENNRLEIWKKWNKKYKLTFKPKTVLNNNLTFTENRTNSELKFSIFLRFSVLTWNLILLIKIRVFSYNISSENFYYRNIPILFLNYLIFILSLIYW